MSRISFDVSSSPRGNLCAIRQNLGHEVHGVGNGQKKPGKGDLITQTQLQEASQHIIQTHPSTEVPCT